MSALYQNLTIGDVYTTGQVLNIMKSVPDVVHGGWIGHLHDADYNVIYDKKVFSKRAMKQCKVINWQSKITGQDGFRFELRSDGKWELDHCALCLL